jgi:hypothetical protein
MANRKEVFDHRKERTTFVAIVESEEMWADVSLSTFPQTYSIIKVL